MVVVKYRSVPGGVLHDIRPISSKIQKCAWKCALQNWDFPWRLNNTLSLKIVSAEYSHTPPGSFPFEDGLEWCWWLCCFQLYVDFLFLYIFWQGWDRKTKVSYLKKIFLLLFGNLLLTELSFTIGGNVVSQDVKSIIEKLIDKSIKSILFDKNRLISLKNRSKSIITKYWFYRFQWCYYIHGRSKVTKRNLEKSITQSAIERSVDKLKKRVFQGITLVPCSLVCSWYERVYLCGFVALSIRMCVAGANKFEGTMS